MVIRVRHLHAPLLAGLKIGHKKNRKDDHARAEVPHLTRLQPQVTRIEIEHCDLLALVIDSDERVVLSNSTAASLLKHILGVPLTFGPGRVGLGEQLCRLRLQARIDLVFLGIGQLHD